MKVYKPPSNIRKVELSNNSIFLAGSIEMGNATDWQKELENFLSDDEGIILNPRRDEWDESWEQDFNNKVFRQQVEWELYGLENVSTIVMYFEPNTKSPISLLELGIHVKSGKLLVCCPDGYMKKGNVETTCNYYNVPILNTFDELKNKLKK